LNRFSPPTRPTVALMWRGDPATPERPTKYAERLAPVFEAFRGAGLEPHPLAYFDENAEALVARLESFDAVLVWINPVSDGRDRSEVDRALREASRADVFVSTHPDVIDRMGTKDVLVATRELGLGGDVRSHGSPTALAENLVDCLAHGGARVLKPVRGNDGQGVLKVSTGEDRSILVRHAADDRAERVSLDELILRLSPHFSSQGRIIDQPFNTNPDAGMVRCYMVRERVAGFGVQHPRRRGDEAFGMNSAKTMHGPDAAAFASLKALMETEWTPRLQRLLGIETRRLPMLWDADFLIRPDAEAALRGPYMLCEIKVSCVSPFADAVPERLASVLCAEMRLGR
jgi:hypothetical protein